MKKWWIFMLLELGIAQKGRTKTKEKDVVKYILKRSKLAFFCQSIIILTFPMINIRSQEDRKEDWINNKNEMLDRTKVMRWKMSGNMCLTLFNFILPLQIYNISILLLSLSVSSLTDLISFIFEWKKIFRFFFLSMATLR